MLIPGKSEDQLSHTLVSELLSNKELLFKDSGSVSTDYRPTVGCQYVLYKYFVIIRRIKHR